MIGHRKKTLLWAVLATNGQERALTPGAAGNLSTWYNDTLSGDTLTIFLRSSQITEDLITQPSVRSSVITYTFPYIPATVGWTSCYLNLTGFPAAGEKKKQNQKQKHIHTKRKERKSTKSGIHPLIFFPISVCLSLIFIASLALQIHSVIYINLMSHVMLP